MEIRNLRLTLLSAGAVMLAISLLTDLPTSASGVVHAPSKASVSVKAPSASIVSTPSPNRNERSGVEHFLSEKKMLQSLRANVLKLRHADGDEDKLGILFDRANLAPPRPPRNLSDNDLSALRAAFKTEVVQLLMAVGVNASMATRMIELGLDPIKAAADHVRGSSTPLQELILSDQIVLAKVGNRLPQDLNDGFRSTVLAGVQSTIYGDKLNEINFRQHTGKDSSGLTISVSTDIEPNTGQIYLLGFSQSYYQQISAEYQLGRRGNSGPIAPNAANVTGLFAPPYIVAGDTLIPAGNSIADGGSLRQVMADLVNIKSKIGR